MESITPKMVLQLRDMFERVNRDLSDAFILHAASKIAINIEESRSLRAEASLRKQSIGLWTPREVGFLS